MSKTNQAPLQVSVITRRPVRIAYLRYQGPFGRPVGHFWHDRVVPWLISNNLMGAPRYGVSQDDPEVTEKKKCRYDAGAEVGPTFVPSQEAQVAVLAGGLYASTKFWGTSEDIPLWWDRVLREWLPASGYQLDGRLCFEFYPPEGAYDPETGKFACELCIPIAKL